MAITSEEFVVKVKADLTAYKKEMEAMKKKYSIMESEVKGIKQKYKEEEKIQKMKEKSESKQNKDRNTSFKELFKTVVKLGIITESFKQIGKVIQEGRENLYWYSKLNNGLYAELADKRTSAIQAFGNAIAAFESMFFNGISPYIEKVFKWLTEFMNRLSRLIANIFDLPTYLQARDDILVEWSKNIKETRMLISGFDKLNIFNGTKNTVPENMFYEVERGDDTTGKALTDLWDWLSQSWTTFWNWIKPAVDNFWTDLKGFFHDIWDWFTRDIYSEYIANWDENGNPTEYGKYLEKASPWTQIKNWFKDMYEGIKTWFIGKDPDSGDTGVWQRYIKPWIDDMWAIVKRFLSDQFDKIYTVIITWWNDTGVGKTMNSMTDMVRNFFSSAPTPSKPTTDHRDGTWWGEFKQFFADFFSGSGPTPKEYVEDEIWPWNWSSNANGGVYTKPTLGLVGEYSNAMSNPELITPQSLLDERLQLNNRDLLSAFNQMSNNIIGAIQGMNMEVRIGDDVIARSASRGQEAYYRQMGRPLIR